jgi:Tfp pilus assembly protein PilF
MTYARQGMLDSALESLGQSVQLQPANQRYRNNIAIVLVDAGKPDQAFEQLAAVHGEATAHYNLGFILARRNMNDQAVGHLQQALAMNPQLTPARQLLDSLAVPAGYAQQTVSQPAHSVSGYPTNPDFVPYSPPTTSRRPLPPL